MERFCISIPKELLQRLDDMLTEKGYSSRSEFIRDLIREKLVEKKWEEEGEVFGVMVLVYDHHTKGVTDKLIQIQHMERIKVISSLHIHISHHDCLEVIVMRGKGDEIQRLANHMESLRGVKFSKLIRAAYLEA
ncbi:nickel-responsive transcriptional regulator NikR [Thermocrinis minervae]|uniref:Putative nickel-responsive regulator n=1 Tax=Thermocrinis minervae TaxID=381751 RepID=A0A1M6QBP7_9AQUI|nr:nickel-responsive transcriptional regulator NikR [Thermocrinis minervae]SHK17601.1 CopG family transcriptional regulator, nickel-responsive regulator [Thermocrinis minervae]